MIAAATSMIIRSRSDDGNVEQNALSLTRELENTHVANFQLIVHREFFPTVDLSPEFPGFSVPRIALRGPWSSTIRGAKNGISVSLNVFSSKVIGYRLQESKNTPMKAMLEKEIYVFFYFISRLKKMKMSSYKEWEGVTTW